MKNEILKILNSQYEALDLMKINDMLELTSAKEYLELQNEIEKLVNEHIVFRTKKEKYILYKNCPNLKVGKLSINKRGSGFLLLEGDDLYINYNNLNGATNGDIVLAETFLYNNETEGKVLKILERNTKNIIGSIYYKNNKPYLKLDDDKKSINIELDHHSTINCVDGTKVLVNTVKELGNNKYLGTVVKIIGHIHDPGVDIKSIAYKYGIFEDFSKETEEQVNKIPTEVLDKHLVNRKDLTNEIILLLMVMTLRI